MNKKTSQKKRTGAETVFSRVPHGPSNYELPKQTDPDTAGPNSQKNDVEEGVGVEVFSIHLVDDANSLLVVFWGNR